MGLFKKRIKNAIRGQAQVVGTTGLSDHTSVQRCTLNLVVRADGIAPYSLEHSCFAKAKHFPYPGMQLPVEVDPKRTDRINILWGEVPDHGDVARTQAEAIAAQMRGAPPAAGGGRPIAGVPPETAAIVDQLKGMFPEATVQVSGSGVVGPDSIKSVEQALGRDLDGDGVVGRSAPPVTEGTSGKDSQVAKLERLAALHESGALSDEEFSAAKQRVLHGPY
ncbi:MAG: SHOCT domain-containing protein [Mycobacterium sp.]